MIDAEGVELDDVEAARTSALLQARDIISHEAIQGAINLAQRIDVFDQADRLVCSLKFEDAVEILR